MHGKYQGKESKAELIIHNGKIVDITYTPVKGRRPLDGRQFEDFQLLTRRFADEIVQK